MNQADEEQIIKIGRYVAKKLLVKRQGRGILNSTVRDSKRT